MRRPRPVPIDLWVGRSVDVWLQLILSTPVALWAGWPFYVRGFRSGVTLVKGDLRGIVKAVTLSRHTMRNIRQNFFFARKGDKISDRSKCRSWLFTSLYRGFLAGSKVTPFPTRTTRLWLAAASSPIFCVVSRG